MESPTFPVVGKVQGCEARAEAIRAIIKAGDPAAEVEVVHWTGKGAWGRHLGRTPQVRNRAPRAATCPCRLPPASAPQSATAWLRRPGLTPTLQLRPQEGSGEPRCPREAGPSHPRPRVLDPQPGRLLTWREGSRKLGGTGGRTTTCAKGGPRPQAATSHAHPGLQGRRPDSCPHALGPAPLPPHGRRGRGRAAPPPSSDRGHGLPGAGRAGHSRFAPIRDSMRSRRLWRSRWTMKSSSERMRKDDTQLTMRRIPLAMESSRLPPSAGGRAALRGSAPPTPQRPGTAA